MPHDAPSEDLNGKLQQILFSPRGSIEGILMNVDSRVVQVALEPAAVNVDALSKAVGHTVEVKASPDRSHKTRNGAHPVYKLQKFRKLDGKPVAEDPSADLVRGVVSAIHYAKHGEPNGVLLETGEFIHTRPPGMKKLGLNVGSRVVASGETRMTVLGTRLLEAHEVNDVKLE